MLTRDFPLRLKGLDQSGSFTGYGSTYGAPADLTGDIVLPGAFAQSIAQQGAGYPLLWSHKQDEPLGIAKVSDSASGLVVNGTLLMSDSGALRAHAFLKAGVIKGMSIGYSLPRGDGKVTYSDDGTRTLKEVHLHEISLVAVPANPRAQVVSVKSIGQIQDVLRGVKPADVNDAVLVQLRGVSAELKRLFAKNEECACVCDECLAGDCVDCSDPECDDPNCEGTMAAAQATEELAALKALSLELKAIVR
jgi:HK97 family phage prohead protease